MARRRIAPSAFGSTPFGSATGRHLLAAVLLPVFAGTAACGALDEFEEVIVDETTIPATSPIATPFSPGHAGSFQGLELGKSRTFQNQGVSPSDVDAIFVKSVNVEMSTGSNNPLIDRLSLYVRSITFYVEAPGVERRVIATRTSFPEAASADLEVTPDLNLKPYAVAPSMDIGAEVVLERQPAVNVKLKTTLTLLIDINLLGS